MNFFRLLFLACFVIVVGWSFSQRPAVKPEAKAAEFTQALRSGNLTEVEKLFGDNSCNCPPRGGYKSFLHYESGQEPNLAFLLGRNFTCGEFTSKQLPDKGSYLIAWQRPESIAVDIPLSFTADNAPYFLPLPTAFGHVLKPQQWSAFLANPGKDWEKGFCLRLRPSLKPGLIKAPVLNDTEKLLPPEISKYLKPSDPGLVLNTSNKPFSLPELEKQMPRLSSVMLNLKVVRRGQIDRWTVARFNFSQAVFTTPAIGLIDSRQADSATPNP